MSDTPETDALVENIGMGCEMVDASFAKRLERERDEARRLLKAATQALNFIHVEVGGWIKTLMDGGRP
jgi:hypothetical protein